jgi:hypothetical protein
MFRLALALGEPKVDELAARLTAAELTEWQAFCLIEPFGSPREDDRARLQALATIGAAGGKADPAELLPAWRPAEPQNPAARVAAFLDGLDAMASASKGD